MHKATLMKEQNQERFLELFMKLGHQGSVCSEMGISYGTVQNWKQDEDFLLLHVAAKEEFDGSLHAEIIKRARDGYEEPLVHNGQIQYLRDPATGELLLDDELLPTVATITRKSERLLVLAAKANIEAYKPTSVVEVTGADGKPIQNHISVEFVTPVVKPPPSPEE